MRNVAALEYDYSSQCSVPRSRWQQRNQRRIAPAASQQTVTLLEDSKTASFLNWARQSGIEFNKLRPATFQGLRGLLASFDIDKEGRPLPARFARQHRFVHL
jgi:hypothetical protein